MSAGDSTAHEIRPAVPYRTRGPSAPMRSRRRCAFTWSGTATSWGRKSAICSSSKARFRPAVSATTSKQSGCSVTISRVLTPIEPVEPRMASRFMQKPTRRNNRSWEKRRGDYRDDRGYRRGPGSASLSPLPQNFFSATTQPDHQPG